MLEFASEEIRQQFHLLPLDRQREIMQAAESQYARGFVTIVEWVEILSSTESEVTIRIDQKFDVRGVGRVVRKGS